MELSRERLLGVYRRMRAIRSFEEKLAELVTAGRLAGFLHLYAGEEATAVGVCTISRTGTSCAPRTAVTGTASPRASTSAG